jgi:phosphatidylserine/phosphatidylglycerophosphate/cardiolipin synthase-like enzyme
MRIVRKKNGLQCQAIAGTYVVLLGWDMTDASLKTGLLGFAIRREDVTEGETYWLRGMKSFPDQPIALGDTASTHEQPIQSFQWGDYTAKPEHKYVYTLIPMYGAPGAMVDGKSVSVEVDTESEWGDEHNVFFNRGAIASQEYVRRFGDKYPREVGPAAYQWLSRGLFEALAAFIELAKDETYGIRAAIYEFQWPAALAEFKAAKARGVDVKVLFDSVDNKDDDPKKKNNAAVDDAKIRGISQGLAEGVLFHNKFIVLLKNDKPIAVWTGSTNLTENGIFGQLNVGHGIQDADVAQQYLDFWNQMKGDPGSKVIRPWCDAATPTPPNPPKKGITCVFSPQTKLDTLQRYADIADSAKNGLFMTFAFGMHKDFQKVYEQDDGVLRFSLMEKEGNGAQLAQGKIDITRIRKLPNVLVAIGHNIVLNLFDRWVKEPPGAIPNANVHWIHTKFMLVDPLGTDPIVITGSANFSEASTKTNEENMVIVRGNRRLAEIFLGEFMRSFAQYAFREAVYIHQQSGKKDDWQPKDLATRAQDWLPPYFRRGSPGELKRKYFSGQ